MIRAVANKRLDLSDEEYEYFMLLKESIGDDPFRGLFLTDKNGIITSITPPINRAIPMVSMFFLLNVMMNQRLRDIDDGISKIKELEDRINALESN